MLNKDKQLLCTFTTDQEYKDTIKKLLGFYIVIENRIFVFSNINNSKEYYLTYNVDCKSGNLKKFPNTISIHRKKNYNTLYTLNGMNKLITEENSGVFDKTFQLNWELYKNSLILTTDIGVKIITLKMIDIIS